MSAARHPTTLRALHWATALLVGAAFALAWWRGSLEDTGLRREVLAWHLTVGAVVLLLTAYRAAWRLRFGRERNAAVASPLEQYASGTAHAALYGLLIAVPVAGWLAVTTRGHAPGLFNLVPLPALLAHDRDLAEVLQGWHETLATALWILLAVHLVAALYHHWVRRDEVLRSML